MAAADALISTVISDYDNVDPTDGDNIPLRAKYLGFLQHIYNYVWNVREWEWTYKESTVIFTAGQNSVAVPVDFMSIGSHGSLYDPSGLEYRPKAKYIVERVRRVGGGAQFPIFGVWDAKIQLTYTVPATTSFTLLHRFAPETLVDDGTDLVMPDRWAIIVLLPGLIFKTQTKKQDEREVWMNQFNAGLSQMAAEENPGKYEDSRMPLAVRGGW